MNSQALAWGGLWLAAGILLLLGSMATLMGLGLTRSLTIAATRMGLQLVLVGYLLQTLFAVQNPWWLLPVVTVMLVTAGLEIRKRQQFAFRGSFALGTVSLMLSAFSVASLALLLIFDLDRWYEPRYAIPLLGMLLGHAMTGIGLALDHLTDALRQSRAAVEARLLMGQSFMQATLAVRQQCIRRGMMPVINALSVAGLVSLPGIMSGQILAGIDPMVAVKYQILLFLLLSATSGFGIMIAVTIGCRYVSDDRQRLRLDRLTRQH